MISIMVATLLSMAAKDPLAVPRNTYFNCLVELHNTSIKSKDSVEVFQTTAKAGCEAEKKGFSDAVFKLERVSMNAKDSQERADEEIQWLLESIVESFTANREDNGIMSKQQ